jgi:hypothetical protein
MTHWLRWNRESALYGRVVAERFWMMTPNRRTLGRREDLITDIGLTLANRAD